MKRFGTAPSTEIKAVSELIVVAKAAAVAQVVIMGTLVLQTNQATATQPLVRTRSMNLQILTFNPLRCSTLVLDMVYPSFYI